ncbi:MAG: ATP-binding cassette domain-containing protein, partial [Xanthobacteraceae bacterium]
MTMRAPASELPITFEEASFVVRGVTILQPTSLILGAGAPVVLVGPNGAGKTTLLRLAMGLIAPTAGRVTWGGRAGAPPKRRAIVFQRPVMLRR